MICASLILGFHLASYHTEPEDYQHNFNPGIYAQCDGWTADIYRNTLGRTSVGLGYTFSYSIFNLTAGVVSGYSRQPGPCRNGYINMPNNPCYLGVTNARVIPMLAPSITLRNFRIWYLPKIRDTSPVFHVSIQKEF